MLLNSETGWNEVQFSHGNHITVDQGRFHLDELSAISYCVKATAISYTTTKGWAKEGLQMKCIFSTIPLPFRNNNDKITAYQFLGLL